MTARAEAAADTGRRVREAMESLFVELRYAEITLAEVARRAGVTLQTVLRRFGSKDALLLATAVEARAQINAQRDEAPVGDVPGAVTNLFDHYELAGALSLRLLEQEHLPQIARFTAEGRATHVRWVERVFAPQLRSGPRKVRRAQLIALTDVYVWKLLRHDQGLSRPEAERAVVELIESLLRPRSKGVSR